jgi:hypothetical protein
VVAFGLFHGLIFLPVLLSLFGSEVSSSIDTRRAIISEEKSPKLVEMQHLNSDSHKNPTSTNLEAEDSLLQQSSP